MQHTLVPQYFSPHKEHKRNSAKTQTTDAALSPIGPTDLFPNDDRENTAILTTVLIPHHPTFSPYILFHKKGIQSHSSN